MKQSYIRKRRSIPVEYCIFDEDGNFIDYTPEFKQSISKVAKQLSRGMDRVSANIFVSYTEGVNPVSIKDIKQG